jgi:aspartate racemase
VEAAAGAVMAKGLTRVSVFGTRSTMTAPFYPAVFSRQGIEIVAPSADEISYIHAAYVNELLNNRFLPETHAGIMEIVESLQRREGIEGIVLGGTELPLLIHEPEHAGVQFFDTTEIHVARIVEQLLA